MAVMPVYSYYSIEQMQCSDLCMRVEDEYLHAEIIHFLNYFCQIRFVTWNFLFERAVSYTI